MGRWFNVPGAGPWFAGSLLVGAVLGFAAIRRRRTPLATLVFIPPLLLLIYFASSYYQAPAPYGGWAAVWREFFSNQCGASECLGEFAGTQPTFAAAAYSAVAALALLLDKADSSDRAPN